MLLSVAAVKANVSFEVCVCFSSGSLWMSTLQTFRPENRKIFVIVEQGSLPLSAKRAIIFYHKKIITIKKHILRNFETHQNWMAFSVGNYRGPLLGYSSSGDCKMLHAVNLYRILLFVASTFQIQKLLILKDSSSACPNGRKRSSDLSENETENQAKTMLKLK